MSKLLSDRVKKRSPLEVPADRYEFIRLSDVEPDLGAPSVSDALLSSDDQGVRSWYNLGAGLDLSGSDIIVDENTVAIDTTGFTNSSANNLQQVLTDLDNAVSSGEVAIVSDDTLVGNGTTATPLGVNPNLDITSITVSSATVSNDFTVTGTSATINPSQITAVVTSPYTQTFSSADWSSTSWLEYDPPTQTALFFNDPSANLIRILTPPSLKLVYNGSWGIGVQTDSIQATIDGTTYDVVDVVYDPNSNEGFIVVDAVVADNPVTSFSLTYNYDNGIVAENDDLSIVAEDNLKIAGGDTEIFSYQSLSITSLSGSVFINTGSDNSPFGDNEFVLGEDGDFTAPGAITASGNITTTADMSAAKITVDNADVNGTLQVTSTLNFVSPDGNNTISVEMLDTDTVSFSGDSGELFSVTDSMTGTIYSVNDISGVPSIEVDDDGTIRFAEITGNVLIGTNVDDGTNKVQVNGSVSATSFVGDLTGNVTGNLTGDVTGDLNGSVFGADASTLVDYTNSRLAGPWGDLYNVNSDGISPGINSNLIDINSNNFLNFNAGTGFLRLGTSNVENVEIHTNLSGSDYTWVFGASDGSLTLPGNITGVDATFTGNLTVSGTTTTVNTTNLDVSDAVITLNTGQSTPLNDIGLLFQRYATADATNYNLGIAWDESADKLIIGKTPEDGSDNDLSFSESWIEIDDTGLVTVSSITSTTVNLQNSSLTSTTSTLATITQTPVILFAAADYSSGKVLVQATDTVSGEVHISELLIAHDGTTAYVTEYGVVFTGLAALAEYAVDINSGNVRLLITSASANSTQYNITQTLVNG